MPNPEDLPHYSYDDYQSWTGDWELIEGIPYAMTPSPTIQHQRISQKMACQLEKALENCPHCRALLAVDWIVSDDTVVQPDNLVICHQETGDFLTQAPVLIIEILSPSTERKDRTTKFKLYEREGVEWYGIVNPKNQVAMIYRLFDGHYIKARDIGLNNHTFELSGGPHGAGLFRHLARTGLSPCRAC